MNFEHLSPINSENIFFERFRRSSFLEKIARWAKKLCYGFIIITIATMVLQLISPFGNDVPDLFMQLLFLLIFWGTIEVMTLPLEYIQDHYIFDFEKNWLALSQQRFFYRRIIAIAAFNQIKAIGVSAQPQFLGASLSDSYKSHYAIFVQTLRNELIQVSDFNLSLDEANAFCHRLYSSHFSGAAYIGGSPGMQIKVDPVSGELATQPARHDFFLAAKLLALPLTQLVLAFLITYSVMALSLSVIQKASKEIFAADLRIRHQPVFQLIAGVPEKSGNTSEDGSEVSTLASAPITIQLPASATVSIDLNHQQVVLARPETPTNAPAKDSQTQKEPGVENNTSEIAVSAPHKNLPADELSQPPAPKSFSSPEAPVAEDKSTSAEVYNQEIIQPAPIMATEEKTSPTEVLPHPKLEPLANPAPPAAFSQQPTPRKTTNSFCQVPDFDPKLLAINLGNTSPKNSPADNKDFSQESPSIIPGYGIHPHIQLGQKLEQALANLGKPITLYTGQNELQVIYSGFSLIVDPHSREIRKILVSDFGRFATMKTPQGIGIGNNLAEVESKFGPYTVSEDLPGIHFANLGISFLPDRQAPEKVGAIQVYSQAK